MNKKISSLLMAATMAATAVTPAFASDIHVTEAGGTGNSKVTFEVVNTGSPEDPTIFSVYVPAVLPIKMDLDGNITVPTNAVIRNGVADKAIQVETATVTTTGDWEHTNKESAEVGAPDSHLLSLSMNNQDLTNASFPWRIDAAGSLDLNMEAVIPQQTTLQADQEIAIVSFVLDWARNKEELNATNEIDKVKMDAALKNLTGKLTFTTTAYTGEGGIDISKNGDGSVMAVVDGQNATVYSEGGVLGINTKGKETVESDFGTVWETGMFANYGFSSIDLRGIDMSNVTNAYGMFVNCVNATSFDFTGINMSNVVMAQSMFNGCVSLTSMDLSWFDTSNVKNISGLFCFCENLQTVDLSGINMSNVLNAYAMFSDCDRLTSVNLSKTSFNNVTNTSNMFLRCYNLGFLDLSETSFDNITNTDRMFEGCYSLKTCYGKTQLDCDKLNTSTNKPSNVNFVVKVA